jgi:hypothetical protein
LGVVKGEMTMNRGDDVKKGTKKSKDTGTSGRDGTCFRRRERTLTQRQDDRRNEEAKLAQILSVSVSKGRRHGKDRGDDEGSTGRSGGTR